jgi:hypothetical protein
MAAPLADPPALARLFEYFAAHECREDPLYVALCRSFAARPEWLALLQHAPPTQRIPNLLLAAVHERVLAGSAQALRDYFPSVGGYRAPDAALDAALAAFLHAERSALVELLASRHTQTNEIGRCAVLWPALCAIVERTGRRRLALLDYGCSAGLNLGVDRYRYDYGARTLGAAAAPGVPIIACRVVARRDAMLHAIERHPPELVARRGIDPAAVDVTDEAQVRWLRACVWPYDRERATRLDQALAIARRERFDVRRSADCTAAIEPWLDTLAGDVQPVVFNSWVLHYLEPAARRAHVAFMRALVQRRGVVWLSAEGAHIALSADGTHSAAGGTAFEAVGDAVIADDAIANGSQWWLTTASAEAAQSTLIARSHPHGRWLQWL